MNKLSFGIRLVIVLPTVFFLFSQILKYSLKIRSKKELVGRAITEFKLIFSWLGERSDREFRWEFFIDSAILSMANGLILIFELNRIEYGVVLLILGIVISLAGFVAIESNSNSGVAILMFSLYVLFLSETFYFFVFGVSFSLLGFDLLPRHIFLLPSLIFLVIIVLAAAFSSMKKTQGAERRHKNH